MKRALLLILMVLFGGEILGQSLSVFNIDTTNFPTIKAKFYAFDAGGNQILNLNPSDFEVTEDGTKRNVTFVSCPALKPPVPISSVLTIDVSGSMSGAGLGYAKEAAKAWVQALPLGQSECAITSFNSKNFFNQDFTTNRNRLLNRIEELTADDGTDFDAALINQMSGGLLAVEKGKYKKVVILLTDGQSTGSESAIIQKAKQINAQVFCVTVGMSCPPILRNISEQTGGQWFEKITTAEQAREIYLKILNIVQGGEPCDIEWESGTSCFAGITDVELRITNLGINAKSNYQSPISSIARLEFNPSTVKFQNPKIGANIDQKVTVTARNGNFIVTNITSTNPSFSIVPKAFTLNSGQIQVLTISYLPTDSGYVYAKLDIENNLCQERYFTSGGWRGKIAKIRTLKLIHPNGGEVFVAGSETVITWEGVTPEEPITIEYRSDDNQPWITETNSAIGLKYNFKVPKIPSDKYLARITAKVPKSDYCDNIDVDICGKTWMGCNLDVDHYRNGDSIPEVRDPNQWRNLKTGAWCYYNNDPANGKIYGKLYNWYAVNDPRGLAPIGWHIPSDAEWTELSDCLGGDSIAGGKLKETGIIHWTDPNIGATDEIGFTALPGGIRVWDGTYSGIQKTGIWRVSTQKDSPTAWIRHMNHDTKIFRRHYYDKEYAFSVRCVKD